MFFRTEKHVVDNRVFLLGLDKLYRDAMKLHEREELLACARRVAGALGATRADVPVEGYYAEDSLLTEYFQLVRALQNVGEESSASVNALPEFQRLRDVMAAPLFGEAEYSGKLFPTGRDALSRALYDTFPNWTVASLTAAACNQAKKTDDISLVGLAARIEDAVVLAAVRESVVLYAEMALASALMPPTPKYIWNVDRDLAQQAKRFIDTFNKLFDEELPPPEPSQAERYWFANEDNEILGRCVRLGSDDSVLPIRHYHWAICRPDNVFAVQDFWRPEIWTTTRYRELREFWRCPKL